MTTLAFLQYLNDLDVKVMLDGDQIRLNGPTEALTAELRADLVRRKPEILSFFKGSARTLVSPAIGRRPETGPLPLSFAQERLWFLSSLEEGNPAYHMPVVLEITGALLPDALELSLSEIVRRHEALRTCFTSQGGRPAQLILPPSGLKLSTIDLSALPEEERAGRVAALSAQETGRPFDLARGPLIRGTLLVLGAQEHVLLVTMHHIASDGWSLGILVREFTGLYRAFAAGKPSPLPELPLQYADFACWQRGYLSGEVLENQLRYWREQLAGAPALLELPLDRPRPARQQSRGETVRFEIGGALVQGLQALSRECDATMFMTLYAAFSLLLTRYSGAKDLVVGTPIANRNKKEIEPLIGFFANTLLLRSDLSGDPSFRELLGRVRHTTLDAYAHQDLPFERLVEELQPERNLSHYPLFQVMFILMNVPMEPLEIDGLGMTALKMGNDAAKFDLSLILQEERDGLTGALEYSTALFDRDTVARMIGHYLTLLEGLVEKPELPISAFELLTPREKSELQAWNATGTDYPRDTCMHRMFEAQVRLAPDQTALVFGQKRLSYAGLNRRANKLAHLLQNSGVGAEVLVGVCLERTDEMVVALLAVLKAGGAYLPLDPAYPKERLGFMLEDTQAAVLLTQKRLAGALPAHGARVVLVDGDAEEIERQGDENPSCGAGAQNLAYIIYTSGSTGRPKGVCIEHGSASTMLHWSRDTYSPLELSGMLASTSICFDLSVYEIFAPLSWGGKIVLAGNALELPGLFAAGEVTLVNTVPSAMAELLRMNGVPSSVVTVNLAGEPLPNHLAQQVYGLKGIGKVYNLYGPSEDTTYSTFSLVQKGSSAQPSIGRPLADTRAYLLDDSLQQVPVGVRGELYLGGAGLSRGYLRRPELNAEKFVNHHLHGRLYRTGDLARFLPDGNLEFLGRIDNQVKIRGFRIEIGEVEAALRAHAEIGDLMVVARESAAGDLQLVAYLVARRETAPATSALRGFLKGMLPEYMIPSVFVFLQALPLTPNGKVDRHGLPDPCGESSEARGQVPVTPLQEILCHVFCEVLGKETVAIEDDFFTMGGHSLLATQVVSRVRGTLGLELPLRALFEAPSVEALARTLEDISAGGKASPHAPVTRGMRQGPIPLSFAQQRMWFLYQLEPRASWYHIPAALRLKGRLDREVLQLSLNDLVARHEQLRTAFVEREGVPFQVVRPAPAAFPLSASDLSAWPRETREAHLLEIAARELARPFDLSHPPLMRATLLELEAEEHVLLVSMHHIVSDGWSMGVLVRELTALYQAHADRAPAPLAELPIQYGDFALWQRDWLQGEVLEAQLSYWKKQLGGELPVLEIPSDRPRPAVQSYRGARFDLVISDSLAEGLRGVSRREGVTLFMTLLAGFKVLLSRYTGLTDIVVGSPIANRNRAEIEGVIGFFVNTLALRTDLSGDPCFRELLGRVRETALGAYAHQDLPFEILVDELSPGRDLGRSPLFQVLFVYQSAPAERLELTGLTVSSVEFDRQAAPFDLTVSVQPDAERLLVTLEYNTDLFACATMDRLAGHFRNLLAGIVADPGAIISELPLLAEAERRKLLWEWNDTAREIEAACLPQLFQAQVARTPEAAAIVFQGEALSYRELDERSNRLARFLVAGAVGAETVVGICLDRTPEMVVAVLGVLKAGGAYLPLDPAYPKERLAFMLVDSLAPLLLTREGLVSSLPEYGGRVICLDLDRGTISRESAHGLEIRSVARNLAYMIYTSGSTGRPKGVMLEHRGLTNLVRAQIEAFHITGASRVLQFASFSFDASVSEIFTALCCGAALCLPDREALYSWEELGRLLKEENITTVTLPPSLLAALPAEGFPALDTVVSAGEPCTPEIVERWSAGRHFINAYGPTESTVCASLVELSGAGGRPPIGRPIANVRLYILDPQLQPVPIGVPGELCVAGVGIARGYWNRPELSVEKFVPDPFAEGRLYKTGDLARYLPDGAIDYLGRLDQQVKIRGFRVEPGEIESLLVQHPGVRDAVVIAREDLPGDRRLVAYLIPEHPEAPESGELRSYLQEQVPDYLIPSAFVRLEAFPLTPNGKVDKGALPPPEGDRNEKSYLAPRTPLERELAGIWEVLLQISQPGVKDNFFAVGGHSLLAVQLIMRIRQQTGKKLGVTDLFRQPTIEGLARFLERESGALAWSPAVQIREGMHPPLFCVHPVGGNVFCYAELGRHLGGDRAFYGLQAPGLEAGQEPLASIEAMARLYLEEVRRIQPEGPYLLCGWSLGAVVAFEMARQLEEQRLEVGFVGLIDPTDLEALDREPDQAGHFAYDLSRLEQMPAHSNAQEHLERHLAVYNAGLGALHRYRPGQYRGNLACIFAGEGEGDSAGWERLTSGTVSCCQTPGDHYSLLQTPQVQPLAERLSALIGGWTGGLY